MIDFRKLIYMLFHRNSLKLHKIYCILGYVKCSDSMNQTDKIRYQLSDYDKYCKPSGRLDAN